MNPLRTEPFSSGSPSSTEDAQPDRRSPLALPVICLTQLIVVLDVSIVNIALPSMQRDLGFSDAGLAWVMDAYTLAFGALLLVGGRAADLFGRRRILMAGIGVFTLGSLLGGLAQGPALLLIGRTLQGVGAAMASPAALSMVTALYREGPERQTAVSAYAAMGAVGAIGGQIFGGVFIHFGSWRWVLFVNVPLGLLLLVLAPRVMPAVAAGGRARLDIPGAVVGTSGLACLVYGAIRAGDDGWTSATPLTLFAAAAVLLAIFILIEIHCPAPMLPLRLLADRGRLAANVTLFLMYGALYPMLFLITRMMQNLHGYDALDTGMAFLPCGIAMLVSAVAAQQIATRAGGRAVMVCGAVFYVAGLVWFATHVRSSYPVLAPAIVVIGIGIAMGTVGTAIAAVERVRPADAGIASGVLDASGEIGGSIGIAVVASIAAQAISQRMQQPGAALPDALAHGFGLGYAITAGIAAVAVLTALAARPAARAEQGSGE